MAEIKRVLPVEEISSVATNKSTSNEKRIKAVIDGTKTSKVAKKENNFFKSNSKDIGIYVLNDVLIPYSKKLIWEIIANAISMTLFGEEAKSISLMNKNRKKGANISYSKYYEDDRREISRERSIRRSVYDFDDIVFEERGEAEYILMHMEDILEEYGMVKVSDMYDLANMTPANTDYNYGWHNLNKASVSRRGRDYIIDLPRAIPLK